jgi:hypothetical protein
MMNPQNPYPRSKQRGITGFLPLRVQVCLNIPSGLRPAEPAVPAIHPTSKLVGIPAKGIKDPSLFAGMFCKFYTA